MARTHFLNIVNDSLEETQSMSGTMHSLRTSNKNKFEFNAWMHASRVCVSAKCLD